MFAIIGIVVVSASVLGGYVGAGGHLDVLWQPFEFVIILGAGIGSFLLGNPKKVISGAAANIKLVFSGTRYGKDHYLELLGLLFTLFKLAKTKGDLALEAHVETPQESTIFQNFQTVFKAHGAVEFLCDYLRLLTLGTSNSHEMENVMEAELDAHHGEMHNISSAVTTLGDAFPALGIVAAVLGVIHTMGSITEPPEILGGLIGGALVGTFFGILVSYGFVAPMGNSMDKAFVDEGRYMQCIKVAIIAHMQGYAPQVSVEFARKTLTHEVRPTFMETEEMIQNLGTTA
jgi:chemotaxis protein MotA